MIHSSKPPSTIKPTEWSKTIRYEQPPELQAEITILRHGYASIAEFIREVRIATVARPTENDAILSMILGELVTIFSGKSPTDYGGQSHQGYSRPSLTERDRMADLGLKWCAGYGDTPHGYIPIYRFNANKTRRDGYDHMCRDCRARYNAAQYQQRKWKAG